MQISSRVKPGGKLFLLGKERQSYLSHTSELRGGWHSHISVAHTDQNNVGLTVQGRGDGAGVLSLTVLTVPAHTPSVLGAWQQAVGSHVLIQSLQTGLCFLLPLLK